MTKDGRVVKPPMPWTFRERLFRLIPYVRRLQDQKFVWINFFDEKRRLVLIESPAMAISELKPLLHLKQVQNFLVQVAFTATELDLETFDRRVSTFKRRTVTKSEMLELISSLAFEQEAPL